MSLPRWQRRKDDRPGEIINAAVELFVEKGFTATRLDDVAARAGVTKGTVYLYFANKEDLFKAVVRETVLPDLEFAEQQVADWHGDNRALLSQLLKNWSELLSTPNTSGIAKLMIAEAANFPELSTFYVNEVADRSRKLFASVIERGIATGEFRAVNVELMSREIIAPMVWFAVWKRCFGVIDDTELKLATFAEFHLDVLLNGIALTPPKS